ncbi:MAG: class I adenylate-forming enzyme family protein [Alphaproteobacteria bacterium]
MVLGEQVAHNARRFGGKTALIEAGGPRFTYAELHRRSNRFAHRLLAAGVGKGDRIAILSHSCAAWVVAYLGIVKSGAIAVPLNFKLTRAEIAANLHGVGCRAVVAAPALYEEHRQALESVESILLGPLGPEPDTGGDPADDRMPAVEILPDDIEVILFTGGTTGSSKGVPLSYANIFWNTVQLVIDTEMHEDDNTILATPLHHAGALNIWLLPHLYLGATATILYPYSPDAFLQAVHDEKVTNGWAPPSMTRDLYTHPRRAQFDLRSFQRWYAAGGPLSRRDRDAIHAMIPGVRIFYQYGLTEAGVIVTSLKEKDYEKAPDSIGRAFVNCEVKILKEDGGDAAVGEIGEIVVRGPAVMKGYHLAPQATRDVFHEGWLRTGDIGAMDENGFVRLHDRLKDMIKTGGLNVYSQEVESVLLRHPGIRDVAVIGMPSDRWGEEVTAVVVRHPGQQVGEAEVVAFAKKNLASYKAPKRIVFIEANELPINYSGKILKRELRARMRGQPGG